jgi:hypothetical protein
VRPHGGALGGEIGRYPARRPTGARKNRRIEAETGVATGK